MLCLRLKGLSDVMLPQETTLTPPTPPAPHTHTQMYLMQTKSYVLCRPAEQVAPQVVLDALVSLMADGVGLGTSGQPTAEEHRLAMSAARLLAQLVDGGPHLAARAADTAAVPCLAALLMTAPRLEPRVRNVRGCRACLQCCRLQVANTTAVVRNACGYWCNGTAVVICQAR